MEVLGDSVARERRSSDPALRHSETDREYDYRRFCTTAWKVGNFLRNEGVRGDALVVVDPSPAPETVLALYGAALLGASVSFGGDATEAKALVAPADRLDDYDAGPSTRRVAYDAAHTDPSVAHFERDVWSENPTRPPDSVDPDATLLATDGDRVTHREALDAASAVVEAGDFGPGTAVAVRASLADPGTVVAGLVAPVVAGGVVVLPGAAAAGDVAVAAGQAPEPRRIDPSAVL